MQTIKTNERCNDLLRSLRSLRIGMFVVTDFDLQASHGSVKRALGLRRSHRYLCIGLGVPRTIRGGMKTMCWSERPAQTETRAWDMTDAEPLVSPKRHFSLSPNSSPNVRVRRTS